MAVLDVVAQEYNKNSEDSSIQNPLDLVAKEYTPANKISRVGASSTRDGYISQYDEGFTPMYRDQNLYRATKQPWTHQLGNALVSGVGSGVMTALEDIGYIADIDNNINRLRGIENVDSNWLSDWAKDNKEALNEAIPIYRKDPNSIFDWSDSGFYYEALKGVLDSAIGFGAVGVGAGALVKGLGTGIRALSRLGNVNRLSAYTDFVVGKGLQQGTLGNASAAYITNFGESKMMALELYETANENVLDELTNQFMDIHGVAPEGKQLLDLQKKASNIAGDEANTFMLRNKLFALSDYAQLGSIFKTQSLARDLVSKPGFKSFIKTQLQTAPKEGLEEIGQNVLEMEGQYQAQQVLKDMGIQVDDAISQENDWVNRVIEFATSDQALLEGMMGLISGPIQYAITTAPFQNKSQDLQRYSDQQTTIIKNKEFFENKNTVIAARTKAIEDAVHNNELKIADLLTNSSFDELVIENFNRGTTEHLENELQARLEDESYTEEERKQVQSKIERLGELESQYNNSYRKYTDSVGVFQNRNIRSTLQETLDILTEQRQILLDNINTEFDVVVSQYNKTEKGQSDPITVNTILDIVNNRDKEGYSNLPKVVKDRIAKSPNIQNYVLNTQGNTPAIEQTILDLDTDYNNMVKGTYQAEFDRLSTISASLEPTDVKVNQINDLLKTSKGLKNPTLTRKIETTKAQLEEAIRVSKQASTVADESPEVVTAKTSKKSPKLATSPIPMFQEPTEEAQTVTTLSPEEQENIDLLKEVSTARASAANDVQELQNIESLSDEEWLQLTQDPENIQDVLAFKEEWDSISPEEKEAIIKESIPATGLFTKIPTAIPNTEPVMTIDEDVKELISVNETKSPEVEVRNYNNNTNEVNTINNAESEISNDITAQQHVKVVTPPDTSNVNSKAYIEWLVNGVNPSGQTVTFNLNNYEKKSLDIFNRIKIGETVSDIDKRYMIDNLAINMRVNDVNNTSTFLYVVRENSNMSPEEQKGVKLERRLRRQIINNLLQDKLAQSTIVGQYGGNLKVTDEDVTIISIPDFKNGKVDDIPFMYINGEGNLMDVNTRELTTNPKFSNKKILLKSTGKPMAGAIFTIVRKANGEQFPLKLNTAPLSTDEKILISELLKNIITPSSEKQNNILNSPVPDILLNLMNVADRNFLNENGSKTITYSMVLNHLVYEGEKSTSNPVTQLLFKNGKVIFGDDEITLDNYFAKKAKLIDFLDKYKSRNINLRKLSTDIRYKRHIINNGLLTTNTDTSGDTLFEAANLTSLYGKDVQAKISNRYKSASVYVMPELIDKAPNLTSVKKVESKPLEVKKNIPNIVKSIDTAKIDTVIETSLETNKENMQLPSINKARSTKRKLDISKMNKLSKSVQQDIETIKNKNDKNKDC